MSEENKNKVNHISRSFGVEGYTSDHYIEDCLKECLEAKKEYFMAQNIGERIFAEERFKRTLEKIGLVITQQAFEDKK